MNRFHPALRLSIALVLLTFGIALSAYFFGLIPDGQKSEIRARAKVAEALAVQLTDAAARNEIDWIKSTMQAVVERNDEVLSAALRRKNGQLAVAAGNHETHWTRTGIGKSTPTHVAVPLTTDGNVWGAVELSFSEPGSDLLAFGFPATVGLFLAFLAGLGLLGYYYILRRALNELDPSRVIPERVQQAFDTLTEGVIIIDDRERILLVNASFEKLFGEVSTGLVGQKISMLPWRGGSDRNDGEPYPWFIAMRERSATKEQMINLRTKGGEFRIFVVKATPIGQEGGAPNGAIVTLDDMTDLQKNNSDLKSAVDRLQQSEMQIKAQNRELAYLANHDPLSGCLNRRAFFAKFETAFDKAQVNASPLVCLMIDLDHFKRINDTYGHAVGDSVIKGVASVLEEQVGQSGFAGRYGGEEFCVVLIGLGEKDIAELTENIRVAIAASSAQLLSGEGTLSASIGCAQREDETASAAELLNRADEAVYTAKEEGRNRVVVWTDDLGQSIGKERKDKQQRRRKDTNRKPGQAQAGKDDKQVSGVAPVSSVEAFTCGVAHAMARVERAGHFFGLLHISFDSLDYLTDAIGAANRAQIKRILQRRIASILRQDDRIVSLENSDDFLVETSEIERQADIDIILKRLLDGLSDPVLIDEETIYVTCRIGAAVYPGDAKTAKDLVRNAGLAVRLQKEGDDGEYIKRFSPSMSDSARERLVIEAGIRKALKHDAFELSYQPIIDAGTGEVCAAEALLRTVAEGLTGVPMDKVIAVAEKSSLIAAIDEWVFKRAIAQMEEWLAAGLQLPLLSVNLSARRLMNTELMDSLLAIIRNLSFPAAYLQIELTETSAVKDIKTAIPQIARLQRAGVQIALDDFGTGQSSLTYLQMLKPDVVKIDRSFVEDVDSSHANATLVSAVTVMAHCLGLKVVAEGVETEGQLEFLRNTKCDAIQGFLVSRALPPAAFGEWMRLFAKGGGVGTKVDRMKSNFERKIA